MKLLSLIAIGFLTVLLGWVSECKFKTKFLNAISELAGVFLIVVVLLVGHHSDNSLTATVMILALFLSIIKKHVINKE